MAKRRPHARNPYTTYGNVAYEVEVQPIPKRKKVVVQPRQQQKRPKSVRKTVTKTNKKTHIKHKYRFQVVFVMLIIFAGCVSFMGANMAVKNKELQIRQQKNVLADVKAQNATLEAELAEQIDLEYIKQEAKTRLGMSEPQSYQIVYIDVPKESYTIQYATGETE